MPAFVARSHRSVHSAAIAAAVLAIFSALRPALAQDGARLFDRFDRNNDGVIEATEVDDQESFQRFLDRLDRNGDGKLQRDELRSALSRREQSREGDPEPSAMPPRPPLIEKLDIPYAAIEGVDPRRLSLDLYIPGAPAPAGAGRPVLIMIHGGGWRIGDKQGRHVVGAKMRHFVAQGYIFASINYRLSTPGSSVRHPDHATDCARALAWLHDNIAAHGGDPAQLHLMGHSAGGHLAGIVGTNERFLKEAGKDLSIIRTNVLLDTAAIDLLAAPRRGRSLPPMYENAFGSDEASLRDASPLHHVAPGRPYPRTLIFYAGRRMDLHLTAPRLAAALTQAGAPSGAIDTVNLSHEEINAKIGTSNDPMTGLIMRLHAGEDATQFPTRLGSAGAEPSPAADSALHTPPGGR